MDSRTKNASRNLIWGLLNKGIALLLPFATRTALIYVLGMEYVGLEALFVALLNVLNIVELGIGSALVYSMYKPVAENDMVKMSALLRFYKNCYRVIGLLVLGIGVMIVPFLPLLIKGAYPSDVSLYVVYAIYLTNTVLGYFLFAYKQSAFIASQRNDILSNINTVLTVLSAGLQIALLVLSRNYYLYIAVLPFITVLNNLAVCFLFNKRFPDLKPIGKLERGSIQEIKTNVIGIMTQKIGTVVLSSSSSLVVSAFLGLLILSKFNNYLYIITALFGLLTIIQKSLIPSIGNSIVVTDESKNYRDFNLFLFLYIWIVGWFACCFIVLSQDFIALWAGRENELPIGIVVCMALYLYSFKMNDMTYIYREAAGIWRQGMFVPLIAALCNVLLSLVLVNLIGLAGVLLSSVFSLVFIYTPWYTKVLFDNYFKSTEKWKRYLLRQLKYFVVSASAAAITYLATLPLGEGTLLSLTLKAFVALVVPNVLFFLAYARSQEMKSALAFAKGLRKRAR